jgi:pimeloyl-ACP methyl ester carboxylesterase
MVFRWPQILADGKDIDFARGQIAESSRSSSEWSVPRLPRVVMGKFHYPRREIIARAYTARMLSRAKRGSLLELASLILLAAVWAATAVASAARSTGVSSEPDVGSMAWIDSGARIRSDASPQAEFPTEIGPYLTPQRLVRVGKERTINLICLGNGSPTIVLTAGLGSWSVVWRWVQPPLARNTRVCAWDAAGFGFSSPSSEPQDAVHLTEDLEQTLKEADVTGPYLMVGHSAGAFVALRFADRHPKSVVGIVLLDPALLEQDAVMRRVAPKFALRVEREFSNQAESLRRCATGLRSGVLKSGTPEFSKCTAAPHMPPAFSPLEGTLARLNADPARLLTQASALESFLSQPEAINPQHRYGAMPLIVLTAGHRDPPPDTPADAREQMTLFYREATRAHDAYAALSTRGEDQLVPDSGHNIPAEKPEAVLAAINRVLAECEPRKPKK